MDDVWIDHHTYMPKDPSSTDAATGDDGTVQRDGLIEPIEQ